MSALHHFERQANALICRLDGETIRVEPWGPDSLRVRAALLEDPDRGSIALLDPDPADAADTAVEIGADCASLRHGRLTARVEAIDSWGGCLQLSFWNQRGELLLREISNGGALKQRARHYKPLPGGNYRLQATFEADPDEKLYGMGQYQQENLDLKGCNLELAHRNSQVSIPFCLSDKGYGFLWHNASVGAVHFGRNTTQWEAENTRGLDYWITAGDSPRQILRTYTRMTGRPPMMPEYGLGFWQCKLRYYHQQQVLDVARAYKRRGIPLDVLVIDYFHWPRCGDFRFDPEYFPDPAAMLRELKELGVTPMVSVWPQIDERSENYPEMRRLGLLVHTNTGADVQMFFHGNNVFFDATNPRARAYVWDKLRRGYADIGVRAFWLDEAEPEFQTYDYDNYRYQAGPVTEVGNIYPREYARMVYEGLRQDGRAGGRRQPDPLRLGGQRPVRCAGLERRCPLRLAELPPPGLRRAEHRAGGHSLVDHRHRRLPRRRRAGPGLPGTAGALVPVRDLLPGHAPPRQPGAPAADRQPGRRGTGMDRRRQRGLELRGGQRGDSGALHPFPGADAPLSAPDHAGRPRDRRPGAAPAVL